MDGKYIVGFSYILHLRLCCWEILALEKHVSLLDSKMELSSLVPLFRLWE